MKKTARICAAILTFTLLPTPLNAITYREWQGLAGLGAISGAVAGMLLYNAMKEKKCRPHQEPNVLILGQKNKQKNNYRTLLSAIASGAIGAASGAVALGWWFWSYTPQARQLQAQEWVHMAQLNQFITQEMDLGDPITVQNRIQEIYARNGEEFTRALAEMRYHERHLAQAQHLCAQANADTRDDLILQVAIQQTQQRINDLIVRVTARIEAIRNNPAYLNELEAADLRHRNQEERLREFERQYRPDNVRWWIWEPQYHDEIVVNLRPVIQYTAPVHRPRHYPRPPHSWNPAPRPVVHAPARPVPPPLKRLLAQAQGGQQQGAHRNQPRVIPIPAQQAFGHGSPYESIFF